MPYLISERSSLPSLNYMNMELKTLCVYGIGPTSVVVGIADMPGAGAALRRALRTAQDYHRISAAGRRGRRLVASFSVAADYTDCGRLAASGDV
eukprot:6190840-Pleurochrysis_carterae.AAC.6